MNKLIFVKNTQEAKRMSAQFKNEKVRRIHKGVYTQDLQSDINALTQQHWMELAGHIVPEGILSFRTAMQIKPISYGEDKLIFMTSSYSKTITLPGLIIKINKGNHTDYIENIFPNLARSNSARQLLENLRVVKSQEFKNLKALSEEEIEYYLAKLLRSQSEDSLNKLRDQAREIASNFNWHTAFKKLNKIITTLLSSHPSERAPLTKYATALINKKPYDANRVELFEKLYTFLKKCQFKSRQYKYFKKSFQYLSFFESYFSNYIEGTCFVLDEAEDIVFAAKEVENRHEDSHDVLAHYIVSSDLIEMTRTPDTSENFLTLLQERHAFLMKVRNEKRPGLFKLKANMAGNSYFVEPADVEGTLCEGFQYYSLLTHPLAKALYMMFLISEVHPFEDGNGRLARIMMNAECVKENIFKIIIPNAYRDNYMNGLRLATRDHNFYTYSKVIDLAQAYTASIPWQDYALAKNALESDSAFITPDEGLPILNRALRKLPLSSFSID